MNGSSRALGRIIAGVGLLVVLSALMANAQEVGDKVLLKAAHERGVPLHREARSSLFARLAHGSTVIVVEIGDQDHWLRVEAENGMEGWIVRRYVDKVLDVSISATGNDPSSDELTVWSSPQGCETVVSAGRRMAETDGDRLRIATWNIRFFPHSSFAVPTNAEERTNLAWLACTMAWINADVFAVQEFRTTDDAQEALESLLDGLTGHTGEVWDSDLDSCDNGRAQHVGYIWNTARVRLSDTQDLWQFNGRAKNEEQKCRHNLRPGRYAFAEAGADFHIVSVHSDSGTKSQDRTTRQMALDRIDDALASMVSADRDVVILGDFNTMGQSDGAANSINNDGRESAAEERKKLAKTVAKEAPGFSVLPVEPGCSYYYEKKAGLLDLVLVTGELRGAVPGPARVTGYCSAANCDRIDEKTMPLAYERLSDHCPVVFSLEKRGQG